MSPVFLMHNTYNIRVFNLIFIGNLCSTIRRTVIDQNNFYIFPSDKKRIHTSSTYNQRDIFQHVPIIFQKPVKPDSMGVPGFSPFGDVHMSFRIPPRLDARE